MGRIRFVPDVRNVSKHRKGLVNQIQGIQLEHEIVLSRGVAVFESVSCALSCGRNPCILRPS